MKALGRPSEGQYRIEGMTKVPAEFDALAGRRVAPFLDRAAIDTRPLGLLLKEVYRQGIIDAVEALSSPHSEK